MSRHLSHTGSTARIVVMPPELANQIAAGEVVERPASVVKELVENSLDAGATLIRVRIEGGGRRLIEVRDDGSGMSRDEAALSLRRHATSKLYSNEDLDRIRTLGFRGEALPSIASVSRFELTTRPAEALEGTRLVVEGGRLQPARPAACPPGTEVQVRDLFFNTPARLKFLKTEATERRHIVVALTRLGLGRTDVHLQLETEGRSTIDAPATTDPHDRASLLLGRQVADGLYPLAQGYRRADIHVSGLFSGPDRVRRNATGIYLFVNGRNVQDRRIRAAITVAYGTLLERGRYPHVVLYVRLPPDQVDVNVHPTKTEVRFYDPDLVFRAVRGALVDGLAAAPWVPAAGTSGPRVYRLRDPEPASERPQLELRSPSAEPIPVQQTLAGTGRLSSDLLGGGWASADPGGDWPAAMADEPPPAYFSSLGYIGRLGDVYLVCQDDAGLVVVDQHAAHERITFERLKQVYAGHHREAQPLLVPLRLELDRVQAATLQEHREFFERVGLELETFSGDTWILRSVPALLQGVSYQRLLRDALDEVAERGHTERLDEAVDAVLSRMACHGSVRAGDRMKPAEVQALLAQMDEIDFRGNCPHGRPVFFRMSWFDLEKRFERR